ncbi:DUF975 family protein [[Clostridium] dakarense]|uniref:DUF975 family protein n=1 Tax=Faecalimicrobium dakarense TaxID=1301100 RepID=UPI0004BAEBDA|nr:DUF975 family protein [[Clostridium] dakarense]
MVSNAELKRRAKEQLSGKWGLAIITLFCYNLVISISGYESEGTMTSIVALIGFLLMGAIEVGASRFTLNLANNKSKAKFTDLFSGFDVFFKALGVTVAVTILVAIGTLLLIIPGIIALFMFSQVYFILAEDSSVGVIECLKRSAKMMKGYKMDYFILQLSFIGWFIACIFTFGIGFLWYIPYNQVTTTNFYLELKECDKELDE